jgi:hypothetical protein
MSAIDEMNRERILRFLLGELGIGDPEVARCDGCGEELGDLAGRVVYDLATKRLSGPYCDECGRVR